ncbi:2-C-methyl-D-erythritol 2,4-cyclodiphosphate synthase [Lachnospiraceae bacterium NE2001]|nr:2-C-methyl-D-erythritol 2,4-cyclodiphosphate synthase [Lachnospiraceae bacterium NE2001]
MRIGMGYDVHKLVEDRPLILGGVTIPYEKGLLGHSDADCLVHAIMDSLLGAAALGDIGKHFPDTDPKYEGADSLKLLAEVKKLLDDRAYIIGNIDATIIAQKPKMAPHIPEMRQKIADTLELELDRINIKATTEEGLGFTGEGLGISCQSIALLETVDNYLYRNVTTGIVDEVEGRGLTDVSREREQVEKIKENRSRNNG